MDVREKLVELFRNAFAAYGDGITGCTREEFFADFIACNGVTVQEWISVKDRLPEDGQSVLTCKNGICAIQTYEARRNGWLCNGWFWSMATVTYWMPLPQPPKGE